MPAQPVGSSIGGQGKAVPVEETMLQLCLPIATAENPKGATRRRTRDRLGAVRAGVPKAIVKAERATSATMDGHRRPRPAATCSGAGMIRGRKPAGGGGHNPPSRRAVYDQRTYGSVGAGAGNRPGYPRVDPCARARPLAVLSGGRGRGGEQLCRALPAECLAWPVVDLRSDPPDVLDRVDAQVGALREVVAQQPVHVLVAASLPRRMRIAEEHACAGLDGDLSVLG